LNFTALAPVKFVPVRVTVVPTAPLMGVKLVMVGGTTTVKLEALVPVPPDVVTLSFPVVTPTGATAFMEVELTTVKLLATAPLNLTAVAPVKFFPVNVTVVPTAPLDGVKFVMLGAAPNKFMVASKHKLASNRANALNMVGPLRNRREILHTNEITIGD
jgi:hypothetical protein